MKRERIPEVGDRVFAHSRNGVFVVLEVYPDSHTVDLRVLKAKAEIGPIEKGIPWGTLTFADEEDASQAAARVVREATEGH